ncbi:MAG: hypothetical protein ABIB47_00420 [Candidatus Woesearchaeota archaeon]
MKKRGVSMFPFVIIFVLLAGAIILMFFFGFAKGVKEQGESVNNLQIVNLLDRELDSFTLAENARDTFEFPSEPEINITCIGGEKSRIQYGDARRDTFKLIAAPGILKGKKLDAWTLAWEYPFKIDNFYYLGNKKIRFYSPYSPPGTAAKIDDNIPATHFSKRNVNQIDAEINQVDNAVNILYSDPVSFNPNLKVKTVKIDTNTKTVTFYKPDGTAEGPEPYWGLPMAIAAIFAEDYNEYKCIKEIAKKRLGRMSEVYEKKARELESKETDPGCKGIYQQIITILDIPFDINGELDGNYESGLIKLNRQLIGKNCPPLFLT